MTQIDALANSFSSKLNFNGSKTSAVANATATNNAVITAATTTDLNLNELDLDTLIQNDTGRKLFSLYLKELNNSCDNLLTLYLICCCFQNHQRIEDRQRIKQILEKTYNACFIKNELTHLSSDLKQKLGDSLQRKTYNESIFNAVKSELKMLLDTQYFPQFLQSNFFNDNLALMRTLIASKHQQVNVTSNTIASSNKPHENVDLINENSEQSVETIANKPTNKQQKASNKSSGSSSFFAMPNVPKQQKNQSQSNTQMTSNTNSTSTTTGAAVTSTNQSNNVRMLKQSKSSSSSTSSVASVCSINRTSGRLAKASNLNSKASKSSLSNEIQLTNGTVSNTTTGKLTKSSSHYKSNASINSLNSLHLQSPMPPNPYHVATKAIPVSAQDSERQSVMSADDYNN
jgi:hypothetical protein